MSNYKVVYNGLWQINILNVDINELDRVGTDLKAFQFVFGIDESSERRVHVQTGPRGHEAFQRALQEEAARQLERSPMPPVVITTGGRSSGRTHNQRVQLEQARLERGEIDLLTYLDNISRDDI